MENLIFKKPITLIFLLVLLISCNKEPEELVSENKPVEVVTFKETRSAFLLGKRLENPYSTENMKKAFRNLTQNEKNSSEDEITTTHYYVKFIPVNEDKLSLLKQDTSIELYDYPLDYEFIEGQEAYHDSEIPIGQPTYWYAAVTVDYSFPDVTYDILEELYIPETGDEAKNKNGFTNVLVTEALRITNNLEDIDFEKGKRWRPAGKVRLRDDFHSNDIPLEGVKVRARRWFTTHTGITNSNGSFSCNGTFRREANYSIIWERYDFEIRDNFGRAKYNGPKKKEDWNLDIVDGPQKYYATIFKGAHHYYHLDILGLRRPPLNSFWNTQLKIRANYEENDIFGVHHPGRRFLGIGTNIEIYNPGSGSEQVYATTIHELAHASHWNMDSWHYNHSSESVAESWANGVQWELTRIIYPGHTPFYFGDEYTGVVEDMIDEIFGYDQVADYTIRQIEDALEGEIYWHNWRTKIQNLHENGTENNLEDLFDYWY